MNLYRDERGETLVEILITMVIMAVGMVAVVAALGGTVLASDTHRSMAEGEVVLRDFGESVKTKAMEVSTYKHCPTKTDLDPTPGSTTVADDLAGDGWQAEITHVAYFIPDDADFPNGTWSADDNTSSCTAYFQANGCPDSGDTFPNCDPGLQRVTVHVWNARTDYGEWDVTARVLTRRNDATTGS